MTVLFNMSKFGLSQEVLWLENLQKSHKLNSISNLETTGAHTVKTWVIMVGTDLP